MKTTIDLSKLLPLTHEKAMKLAQVAAKYHSTITLENDHIVLNAKSMIGLLSQSLPKDGIVSLVINGADQAQAYEAIQTALQSMH